MTTRSLHIHAARVYLAQSRHFARLHRQFSFVLLSWAGNARRRAMQERQALDLPGFLHDRQMSLFGDSEAHV